jgi:hypothetical protein
MRMSGSLAAAREQMAASAKLRSLVGVDSDACFARRRQQSDEPRNDSSSLPHRGLLVKLRFVGGCRESANFGLARAEGPF